MENFAQLTAQLLAADGAQQVADEPALEEAAAALLADRERRAARVENGLRVLQAHRGAARRTAHWLLGRNRGEKSLEPEGRIF